MISPARFPNQKTSTDCLFMLSCALTPSLPLAHRCAPSPSATSPSPASLTSLSVSVHLPSSSLYAISAPHTDTSALLCLCLLHLRAPPPQPSAAQPLSPTNSTPLRRLRLVPARVSHSDSAVCPVHQSVRTHALTRPGASPHPAQLFFVLFQPRRPRLGRVGRRNFS